MSKRGSLSTDLAVSRYFAIITMSLLVPGCIPSLVDAGRDGEKQLSDNQVQVTDAAVIDSQTMPDQSVTAPAKPPTTAASTTPPVPTVDDRLRYAELPLSDVSYALPLTIRHVTQTSVTLLFELERPTPASLVVRSSDGTERTEVVLAPAQTRHQVSFDELTSDTSYDALVLIEAEGGELAQPAFLSQPWGPVSFRTASDDDTLRIGVIGDASFGDPVTSALVQAMAEADLDFVLHTGDVVDETEQDVNPFQSYAEKFYTPFAPLLTQMPVYTVIGNHDYDADIRWQGAPFYYYAFPSFSGPMFPAQGDRPRNQYYAFAYQGVQFLMLDSQVFFGQPGREEQEAWLAERLADPEFRMTIPVFHVSPFSSSSVHPTDSLPVRYTWTPLFETADVPVVFSGHFHQYERLRSNNVTYIVSSGGSSILYASGELLPESEVLRQQSHYVLLEIDGERIRLSARALGDEVIDQVELQ